MRTAVVVSLFVAASLCAQDGGWVRDWERAQRERPASIAEEGRIAPAGEPGTPMVVRGMIVEADGRTPVADVVVFAYQTDDAGVYNARGKSGWRLRGWAKSGADGRFAFHTIRPGSYPGRRNPAHIHVTIEGPGLQRRWTEEVQFADDPLADRSRPGVLPVTTRNGVQYVDYLIRVEERGKF